MPKNQDDNFFLQTFKNLQNLVNTLIELEGHKIYCNLLNMEDILYIKS